MEVPKRVDENQTEIVAQLNAFIGVSVWSTAGLGNGFSDIVVGYKGRNYLFEIKNPDQPLSKRKLTKAEQKFFVEWEGGVDVIHSAEHAMEIILAAEKRRR